LKEGSIGCWEVFYPSVLDNRIISEEGDPHRPFPFGKLLRSLPGRLENLLGR
jgi:hypothetical protein